MRKLLALLLLLLTLTGCNSEPIVVDYSKAGIYPLSLDNYLEFYTIKESHALQQSQDLTTTQVYLSYNLRVNDNYRNRINQSSSVKECNLAANLTWRVYKVTSVNPETGEYETVVSEEYENDEIKKFINSSLGQAISTIEITWLSVYTDYDMFNPIVIYYLEGTPVSSTSIPVSFFEECDCVYILTPSIEVTKVSGQISLTD